MCHIVSFFWFLLQNKCRGVNLRSSWPLTSISQWFSLNKYIKNTKDTFETKSPKFILRKTRKWETMDVKTTADGFVSLYFSLPLAAVQLLMLGKEEKHNLLMWLYFCVSYSLILDVKTSIKFDSRDLSAFPSKRAQSFKGKIRKQLPYVLCTTLAVTGKKSLFFPPHLSPIVFFAIHHLDNDNKLVRLLATIIRGSQAIDHK